MSHAPTRQPSRRRIRRRLFPTLLSLSMLLACWWDNDDPMGPDLVVEEEAPRTVDQLLTCRANVR